MLHLVSGTQVLSTRPLILFPNVEIMDYLAALPCTVATFENISTKYMVYLFFLAALHEDILEH